MPAPLLCLIFCSAFRSLLLCGRSIPASRLCSTHTAGRNRFFVRRNDDVPCVHPIPEPLESPKMKPERIWKNFSSTLVDNLNSNFTNLVCVSCGILPQLNRLKHLCLFVSTGLLSSLNSALHVYHDRTIELSCKPNTCGTL